MFFRRRDRRNQPEKTGAPKEALTPPRDGALLPLPARPRRAHRPHAVRNARVPAHALRRLLRLHGPLLRQRPQEIRRRDGLGRPHARLRRRGRAARARGARVPRNHRRGLDQEERARRRLPRPLRQQARRTRHPPQRLGPARRNAGPPDQGRARHRRPALLRTLRHRPPRHLPRAHRERAGAGRRPGRLLDHAAAREEPVPLERAHARTQGERGVPRDLARDAAHETRDPEALPRPRLSRRRRVRRRRRRAILLREIRARREPRGSGDARGAVQGAGEIRAAHQPRRGPLPRLDRARQPRRGRTS